MKVKKSIRDAAKKGQKDVCKILAKEIVQSRKAVSKWLFWLVWGEPLLCKN